MRWIGMSEDGNRVELSRFDGDFALAPQPDDPDHLRTGVVVDVEATGLDIESDTVIEFAGRPFQFDRLTGEVVEVGPVVSCLHDPGVPLSPEIVRLTGITDAAGNLIIPTNNVFDVMAGEILTFMFDGTAFALNTNFTPGYSVGAFAVDPIPVPAAGLLFGTAAIGGAIARRRRKAS